MSGIEENTLNNGSNGDNVTPTLTQPLDGSTTDILAIHGDGGEDVTVVTFAACRKK
jgi:hypothetical protein